MSYWIDAKGFNNYEISNDGYVRNKKTKKILKPYLNRPGGYYRVDIEGKHVYIHKIMANSFFANCKSNDKITFIDKNRYNINLKNLKYN